MVLLGKNLNGNQRGEHGCVANQKCDEHQLPCVFLCKHGLSLLVIDTGLSDIIELALGVFSNFVVDPFAFEQVIFEVKALYGENIYIVAAQFLDEFLSGTASPPSVCNPLSCGVPAFTSQAS